VVEAFYAGAAACARIERTTRDAERVISWSLREDHDAPAASPLTVKAIVADGTRLVRARLLDGRAAELPLLADELSELVLRGRRVTIEAA
jgi:hypothetical protein